MNHFCIVIQYDCPWRKEEEDMGMGLDIPRRDVLAAFEAFGLKEGGSSFFLNENVRKASLIIYAGSFITLCREKAAHFKEQENKGAPRNRFEY
jgi:hypothetical protein